MTMISLIIFISLYCDKLSHLILSTLYLGIAIFFGLHFLYLEKLTMGQFFMNISLIIAFFICTFVIALVMIYVQ